MIVCFQGTPGSGKSYEAVKKIVDNLRLGAKIDAAQEKAPDSALAKRKARVVYTNIDGMDQPECREMIKCLTGLDDYRLGKRLLHLDRNQVPKFWQHTKDGSLVVIDEAHKFYNSRDWDKEGNREFSDWASTHRHLGYDLVLITQKVDKIDKQVRSLIEWTYAYRKVNFLGSGIQKKYLVHAFSGEDTEGAPLTKNVRTYSPEIFRCYESYATKDAKEVGFMQHVNVLKHPVFFAIPLVLCLALYLLFGKSSFASGDLFGAKKIMHRADAQRTNLAKKTDSPAPGLLPSPPSPSPSPSAGVPPVLPPPPPVYPVISSGRLVRGPGAPAGGWPPAPPPAPSPSRQEFYTWTDKNGQLHMSNLKDRVPLGSKSRKYVY